MERRRWHSIESGGRRGGHNCDLGATTQSGGQVGVGVRVVLSIGRMLERHQLARGTLSVTSKAVSFVRASSSSLWLISVYKLGVVLALFPTSHRATQPFAHIHC